MRAVCCPQSRSDAKAPLTDTLELHLCPRHVPSPEKAGNGKYLPQTIRTMMCGRDCGLMAADAVVSAKVRLSRMEEKTSSTRVYDIPC